MKRITTLILLIALVAGSATSYAQVDEEKMNRDLRVASNVLGSLMNNDSDHLFRGGEPEGSYVDGYGVIFTIEDNMVFRYNYKIQWEAARDAQREVARAMRESRMAQKEAAKAQEEIAKQKEELEKEKEALKDMKGNSKGKNVVIVSPAAPVVAVPDVDVNVDWEVDEEKMKEYEEKIEAANDEFNKNLREAFETFLVDYSQLIGQLKPTDKILLTTKSNNDFVFYMGDDDKNVEKSRLSAEMLVKDHKDFEAGRLSREKLIDKIKFIENAEMERKPDLDLFANMLKTAYDQRYTETYFISSSPKYELLSGLGAVYNVKIYSSYEDNGLYRIPGIKQSNLNKEDRDKSVEALYPKFLESFKENIVRYGSTIKSLEDGSKLIIDVKMTKCDSCSFPENIEFTVDKSVLDQFSKGSLTLEQAKNKVKLKN
ncbi:MAG: hypothetical protein KDC79_11440 [Cyclobacteriaceae bacterium]|nr:hypothetical protein [Cyclobacteriaceae bacterium]